LTYIFPARFSPKINNELPADNGFEYVVLALWDSPKKDGIPQLAFIHDTRQRPSSWSKQQIAEQYIVGLKKIALSWKDARVSDSKKISTSAIEMWRVDYWHSPDAGPAYNAAVVIPLKDRSVLAIQLNASSQNALDDEVDSLRQLKFDPR